LVVAAAAIAAFASFPASAGGHGPVVTYGFGFGFGYPGYYPYRPYYPYYGGYYPFWGPTVGVGVHVGGPVVHEHRDNGNGGGQQGTLKLYVYPAAGQSEAQTAEDRYQCHVWAADQSGYDPTQGTKSREDAEGYTRAFTACMTGRNYVVK
jgi:hypothetical protein